MRWGPRRPSIEHRRRTRQVSGLLTAVTAVVTAVGLLTGALQLSGPGSPATTATPPWDYSAPAWQTILGTDSPPTRQTYHDLAAWADPQLAAADRDTLAQLADAVTSADLTDVGRSAFTGYWPGPARTGTPPGVPCTHLTLLAASPTQVAVDDGNPAAADGAVYQRYAKVLVAYTGTCAGTVYTLGTPGVEYVYAGDTGHSWVPLRDWNLPAADTTDLQTATEPYSWELGQFPAACSGGLLWRDRFVVVDAFNVLCTAARNAGIPLTLTAAYRTRGEQAALYAQAVASYGAAEASQHVAYADSTTCQSAHCSGLAVNVNPTATVLAWLDDTVGCVDADGDVSAGTTCPVGGSPVPRSEQYGFAATLSSDPGYLEFTLPIGSGAGGSLGAADCDPAGVPVPDMVAAIFRCRLARDGISGAEQDTIVAQAEVISRCESGWNATAEAFGGRFASTPDPADGQLYTEQGVFMIDAATANSGWVEGGSGALQNPVANINGAASLWLATRGWEQFGCATGVTGGFEGGPVLAVYGGPPLPSWARSY